jgi:hypothetical protein
VSLCFGYFVYCNKRGNEWNLKNFVVPTTALLIAAFCLQPNPIKHIHIPEYGLLYVLVWLAFARDRYTDEALISVFTCVVMFGVIDELLQGVHPERYYGWKDMLINAIGGLVGLLWVRAFWWQEKTNSRLNISFDVLVFMMFLITLAPSLITLLAVQKVAEFEGVYPFWLLLLNVVTVVTCLMIAARRRTRLVSAPAILNALSHGIIGWLAISNAVFR